MLAIPEDDDDSDPDELKSPIEDDWGSDVDEASEVLGGETDVDDATLED